MCVMGLLGSDPLVVDKLGCRDPKVKCKLKHTNTQVFRREKTEGLTLDLMTKFTLLVYKIRIESKSLSARTWAPSRPGSGSITTQTLTLERSAL